MKKVNRLDVYLGLSTNEALDIMKTWGNRKDYVNDSTAQHLINNMNGWLAEEIFKATFPEWEYIDKEDHVYLHEFTSWGDRTGKPDFRTVCDDIYITCEVKKCYSLSALAEKIEKWKAQKEVAKLKKNWNTELHNATSTYCLVCGKWYYLNTNDWTYSYECDAEYPSWWKGWYSIKF